MRFLTVLLFSLPVLHGQTLLVLHKGGSSLGFYTFDGKLQNTVPTGTHPHEMEFSSDGRLLYTTDNGTMRIEHAGSGGNSISVIDIATRTRVAQISLGKYHRPHGIDLDRATGRLAVSCEFPDQLLIVDPVKREVVKTYDTQGKTAHMVTFGPGARWAYVSNSSSANVAAVELATGKVILIPTGTRPEGSVLARDGRELYVANREAASVSVIDTARQAVVGEIRTAKGPVRIEITPDGKQLVYAAMHDRKVEFADPKARKVIGQVALGGTPVSLHLSADGKLAFASAEETDTVYVISVPERKILREFRTAPGSGPDPVMLLAK